MELAMFFLLHLYSLNLIYASRRLKGKAIFFGDRAPWLFHHSTWNMDIMNAFATHDGGR
jgi:hypothetical protein